MNIEGVDAHITRYAVKDTEDPETFDVTITVRAKNCRQTVEHIEAVLHPLATLQAITDRQRVLRAFEEGS